MKIEEDDMKAVKLREEVEQLRDQLEESHHIAD
jgi:hypothetical protein